MMKERKSGLNVTDLMKKIHAHCREGFPYETACSLNGMKPNKVDNLRDLNPKFNKMIEKALKNGRLKRFLIIIWIKPLRFLATLLCLQMDEDEPSSICKYLEKTEFRLERIQRRVRVEQ